jgi:hypothetical protein
MSVPLILVRHMRKKALQHAREGIHNLNTPDPFG